MAWSASGIFGQMIADTFAGTQIQDLNAPSDTIKSALYNNSITPDKTVSAANSAYNAGQWANTNELSDAAEWAAGGVALASPVFTHTSGTCKFDGTDTASGSSATLAAVFGCLNYNDTDTTPVADPGICYNYFGGTNSVTDGTLTVVWHASGIFTITV